MLKTRYTKAPIAMRKFNFFCLLMVAICSCQNPKAKLVELQKQTIDSMSVAQKSIDVTLVNRAQKTKDSLLKAHPDWVVDGNFNSTIMADTIAYFGSDEVQALVKTFLNLKKRNDSIEIEIKKY